VAAADVHVCLAEAAAAAAAAACCNAVMQADAGNFQSAEIYALLQPRTVPNTACWGVCPSCLQVIGNLKSKSARGWLLYDYQEDGEDDQPDSPAAAAAAAAAADAAAPAAAAAATGGDSSSGSRTANSLGQWLVKLVPGLSAEVLQQQLGCVSLDRLLQVPGLFDSLLVVTPADKEGFPGNM
jgi:hypothetical protein